jgi:hypothetical protein
MLRPSVNKYWDLKHMVNEVKVMSSSQPELLQNILPMAMWTENLTAK